MTRWQIVWRKHLSGWGFGYLGVERIYHGRLLRSWQFGPLEIRKWETDS